MTPEQAKLNIIETTTKFVMSNIEYNANWFTYDSGQVFFTISTKANDIKAMKFIKDNYSLTHCVKCFIMNDILHTYAELEFTSERPIMENDLTQNEQESNVYTRSQDWA